MDKLFWFAPLLLLAGCSRTQSPQNSASDPAAHPGNPEPAAVREIPSGTALHVRVDESITTRANHAGDGFTATLSVPVDVDGRTYVPAGTQFAGHVTRSAASGRMKGRAQIGLTLDSFELQGREYRVRTTSVDRVS